MSLAELSGYGGQRHTAACSVGHLSYAVAKDLVEVPLQ